MNQLMDGLDKVKLGIGVIQGLMVSATAGIGNAGLGLTLDKGLARVGPTAASVAALADKAAPGMNAPGTELEYVGGTHAVPNAATRLVWLKSDGTIVDTADLAAGQSYSDVAPELTPDPNSGAMIVGFNVSQEGPLRQAHPASVLLARVTTAGGAVTAISNLVRSITLLGQ